MRCAPLLQMHSLQSEQLLLVKTVIRFHTKAGPVVVAASSPKPVEFSANVTRFEEVSPMHTLSTLGAPSSSRSRD